MSGSNHIGPPDSDDFCEFDSYRMKVRRATTWRCWHCWAALRARALPRGWRQLVYLHPAGPRLSVAICSDACTLRDLARQLRTPGVRLVGIDDGAAPAWQPARSSA